MSRATPSRRKIKAPEKPPFNRDALRWTDPVTPDLAPPEHIGELRKGFLYNSHLGSYGPRVEPACTSAVSHAFGRDDQTTSQRAVSLYSTRLLALRALRHDVEKQAAKILTRIDEQIANEEQASK